MRMSNSGPDTISQIDFIIANAHVLDRQSKINIMQIVQQEYSEYVKDKEGNKKYIIMTNKTTGDISIRLDYIEDKKIIYCIYIIVENRLSILNKPAT